MSSANNRPLFRHNAMMHYMNNEKKKNAPHFLSLPITLCLWLAFVLLILALGFVSWRMQIPVNITGSGVITTVNSDIGPTADQTTKQASTNLTAKKSHTNTTIQPQGTTANVNETVAVALLPPEQTSKLRIHQPVHLSIGNATLQEDGTVANIGKSPLTPNEIYTQYHLDKSTVFITQPLIAVLIHVSPTFPLTHYTGTLFTAQIQVGTQCLLALFPYIGTLFQS
ncbi:MAG TPA: hypothetical protein VL461_14405 [Dictyobacter sp.]|jgi:hypothetical protein|nr:hypothetical protein [Dictyobacter sp.]